MWQLKGLLLIWIACGIGLLGYGILEATRSYYIMSSTETYTIEGTIAGKYVKTWESHHAGGHTEFHIGLPQPVVEWKDRSGASHQSTDTNIFPYFIYETGQKISLKVYLNEAQPAHSQVYVNDYYTRFAFPAALMILGAIFVVLPIVGWMILGTEIEEVASGSSSFFPIFSFVLKYFIWPFLFFVLFAGLMAARPYLKGLLPDSWTWKNNPPPLVENIEQAALPLTPGTSPGRTQTAAAATDPERILDERTRETSLMRELKRGDPEITRAMMERKFDPNTRDAYGRNVLYYAVSGQKADSVCKLIGLGADIEGSSVDVLIEAIEVRNSAIAHLLLDAGKAVNTLDKRYNMYPFDMAVYHELPDVAVRLAKQDIRHTAPDEFVEITRNPGKYSGAGAPKKGFHGMSLQRWWTWSGNDGQQDSFGYSCKTF